MSWNFKKFGTNIEALKASVQAEFAPPSIKDEVCARIDAYSPLAENQAVAVESYGHLESDAARPWKSVDQIVIRVGRVPTINTPLTP
jgi:hypothetical protein